MRTPSSLALLSIFFHAARVWAATEAHRPPPPSDAECLPLPALNIPFSFARGERLEFDLDTMGALAGEMTMRTLAPKEGALPVEVTVQTNTFFSKVRRVRGVAQSFLNPTTLRPRKYSEESVENEVARTARVTFHPDKTVKLKYSVAQRSGEAKMSYANEGLDVAGAIYLLRQLPLADNLPICFDAYGVRRIWRVFGKVAGKEKVSLPLGEFEAWHVAGEAVRLDDKRARREIHVWISADARRLPLAALGTIDLGAVRATLKAFHRPGDKKLRAQGKESLKW